MINQAKREEVIKILDDSADSVRLEELFLYDLSPYYCEKGDDSFFSKQLEYLNENYLLLHSEKKISFTSEQKNIYNEIFNNDRLVISAPTSFGKTMLIKEYIFNEKPKNIAFLVPTNSLADELIEDFFKIFNKYGYSVFDTIKDNGKISEKNIFIGTQEKYYQVYQNNNFEIDLFVIDEAYKLSNNIIGSREVILNRAFIDTINKAKKSILLLPLVNHINGINNLNFKILKSDYAPVAKNFIKIEEGSFDNEIIKKISENKENNLIYFNSPNDVEKFFVKKISNSEKKHVISDEWLDRVKKDFHPDWIPIKALDEGIGIHYGPMPKFIQKKVIDLFNNGQIKTLLGTSSVIEGVNTPTKNIYISTSRDILGSKNVIKFKNLIGRAGRLGIHKIGNIYYKDIHSKDFNKANMPYQDIDLDFTIENPSQILEINREMEYKIYDINPSNNEVNTSFEFNRNETIEYLKKSTNGKVPVEKISIILNRYGFTLKQFKELIDYSTNQNISIFGILGKLKASDKDIFSINEIINNKTETINEILVDLMQNEKYKHLKNPQLVSIIVKMIYNSIPHKIIPALDFIIELNDLYIEHNKKDLFSKRNIDEAKRKKVLFYNKFIGEEVSNIEDSKKIMSKLFEYGVPYFRVKNHFDKIASNIPDNFSIYNIRDIINNDDSMKELRIYFE